MNDPELMKAWQRADGRYRFYLVEKKTSAKKTEVDISDIS